MRNLALLALVLLVWVMLGFHFAASSDGGDRGLAFGVGVVITILAFLASRRPSPPTSRDSGFGGADSGFSDGDSHASHHHGGDDGGGHGGSDGGDGGGH
jgi:hypothetical protein